MTGLRSRSRVSDVSAGLAFVQLGRGKARLIHSHGDFRSLPRVPQQRGPSRLRANVKHQYTVDVECFADRLEALCYPGFERFLRHELCRSKGNSMQNLIAICQRRCASLPLCNVLDMQQQNVPPCEGISLDVEFGPKHSAVLGAAVPLARDRVVRCQTLQQLRRFGRRPGRRIRGKRLQVEFQHLLPAITEQRS